MLIPFLKDLNDASLYVQILRAWCGVGGSRMIAHWLAKQSNDLLIKGYYSERAYLSSASDAAPTMNTLNWFMRKIHMSSGFIALVGRRKMRVNLH